MTYKTETCPHVQMPPVTAGRNIITEGHRFTLVTSGINPAISVLISHYSETFFSIQSYKELSWTYSAESKRAALIVADRVIQSELKA